MTIQVLFFAHYPDIVGSRELPVTLPEGASVRVCASELEGRYPKLGRLLNSVRVAVNSEMATPETGLHDGDEVAFLPPMSGG